MSDTRTAPTEDAYLRRYRQLKRQFMASAVPPFTVAAFASMLIDTKRPTLSAASWRQYRAAACYGLEQEQLANPALAVRIEAAVARLRAAPPVKQRRVDLHTSQKKAKRLRANRYE